MCSEACRLILLIVNILVASAGFVLTVIGSLLIWGKAFITEELKEVIGPWIQQLYGENMAKEVSEIADKVLKFTSPFGVPIFVVGLIIMLICTFGCCGSCRKNVQCLKIYVTLLLVSVIAQIACMSFYYTDREKVFTVAYNYLDDALLQYESIHSNDASSVIFTVMMGALNCCGLKGGNDFMNSTKFQRHIVYNEVTYDLKYPIPCCKMDSKFRIINQTCPGEFTESNSNYNIGCWSKLKAFLSHYINVCVLVGVVVIGFQLMLVIISVVSIALRQ